ncbi:MAG: AMP-binding protein [bacterium]
MFDLLKYKDNIACIDNNGDLFTYEDVNNISMMIGKYVEPHKLVFSITTNTIESVAGYISFMNRECTTLLLGKDIDVVKLVKYSDTYEPIYYWVPNEFIDLLSLKEICFSYGNYSLLRSNYVCDKIMPLNLNLLLTTSGSTGSPKLVRLSKRNLLSNAESIKEYLNLGADDRTVTSLPMNYSFGLSIINSYLLSGSSILLTDLSYIQKEFWSLFDQFECTSFSGVPYTFEILKKIKFWSKEHKNLRTLTQAGGKLNNDLIRYFTDNSESRGVQFYVMYGQTEATARISYLPPDMVKEKIGSIGKVIPNGKLLLIDEFSGEILDSNVVGELVYKGENVSLGYAENKDELTSVDVNDSYLKTGDLAYRDGDGYYFITGRKSRFLKLFGNRINLDQIEILLKSQHLSAACVGSDEKLIVYVEEYSTEKLIVDYISNEIKINRKAIEVRFIEKLPRSESGKILYSKLLNI